MKVLVLYTRLAGYFMACIRELSKHVAEIHIVCKPPDNNAPFNFEYPENVFIHTRTSFSNQSLLRFVETLQPSVITSSGWRDLGYLKVCKLMHGKIPTVLLMDNKWRNSLKQRIFCGFSHKWLTSVFSSVWVPGPSQKLYASYLGFKPEAVFEGLLSADSEFFRQYALYRLEAGIFPQRFLFIGRYKKEKGIDLLIRAFIELQNEQPNNWELWCAGTGPLVNKIVPHPKIRHLGFVQPQHMHNLLEKTGVFILPSRFEPWGVVVQEMAVAGFPLIVSSEVGAAVNFVDKNNGYVFVNKNVESLKVAMKNIIGMNNQQLKQMAGNSAQIGLSHTTQKWVETIFKIINRQGEG